MRYLWASLLVIVGILRFASGREVQGAISLILGIIVFFIPEESREKKLQKNRSKQLEDVWDSLRPGFQPGVSILQKTISWSKYSAIAPVFGMKQIANKLAAVLGPKIGKVADPQLQQAALHQLKQVTEGMDSHRPANSREMVAAFQPKDDLLFSIFPFSGRLNNEAPASGLLLVSISHLLFIDLPETAENATLLQQLGRVELNLGAREGEVYQVGLFKQQLTSGRDLDQLFLPAAIREALLAAHDNHSTISCDLREVQQISWTPPDKEAGHVAAVLVQTASQYFQFWLPQGGSVVGIRAAATAMMEGCWLSGNPLLPALFDNGARGWKRPELAAVAAASAS